MLQKNFRSEKESETETEGEKESELWWKMSLAGILYGSLLILYQSIKPTNFAYVDVFCEF